ncbi:MAG: hypothetical protein IPK33_02955 [Gemmatimonadetes bacterium]|nr:hypothetical protein [Gemmatimonadota bacterium]
MSSRRGVAMLLTAIALGAGACKPDPVAPEIKAVTLDETSDLTERTVAEVLIDAMRVTVRGTRDQGLPKKAVEFTVDGVSDSAKIAGKKVDTVVTNNEGVAVSGPWTLGRRPGTYRLSARTLEGGLSSRAGQS